jgi:branched-chain amino acid transport system permease protein
MAVLMAIMGGTRIVYGPIVGAAVITILESICSIYAPERWPLILGGVFVVTVVFIRGGITAPIMNLSKRITLGSYGSTKT